MTPPFTVAHWHAWLTWVARLGHGDRGEWVLAAAALVWAAYYIIDFSAFQFRLISFFVALASVLLINDPRLTAGWPIAKPAVTAGIVLVFLVVEGGLRITYLVVAAACVIFAFLEPLGVSAHVRLVLRDALIGFGLIVCVVEHVLKTRAAHDAAAHGVAMFICVYERLRRRLWLRLLPVITLVDDALLRRLRVRRQRVRFECLQDDSFFDRLLQNPARLRLVRVLLACRVMEPGLLAAVIGLGGDELEDHVRSLEHHGVAREHYSLSERRTLLSLTPGGRQRFARYDRDKDWRAWAFMDDLQLFTAVGAGIALYHESNQPGPRHHETILIVGAVALSVIGTSSLIPRACAAVRARAIRLGIVGVRLGRALVGAAARRPAITDGGEAAAWRGPLHTN